MRIPLNDIKNASQCFRYYNFLQSVERKPTNPLVSIAEKVMQKCYLKASETGFKAQWRQITGWVDVKVFKDVDVHDDEQYRLAKRQSESILTFLHKWYRGTYLPGSGIGYINIPLEDSVTYRHVVHAKAPLVTLEEIPHLVLIGDESRAEYQLRRDVFAQGLAYMVSQALEVDTIGIQYFCIKVQGGFETNSYQISGDQLKRSRDVVNQVAQLIGAQVDFPSFTEQCASCPFKKRCKI